MDWYVNDMKISNANQGVVNQVILDIERKFGKS